jgi:hypothetical protein
MRILTPLFLLLFLLCPLLVAAQPGDPGGDPDVPITGIEFLLGGGALLGIRQLWARAKSSVKK